jgi:methylated-DNA-[protein]-cysteine S-methyltransferase
MDRDTGPSPTGGAGLYARAFDDTGVVQVGAAAGNVISVSFPDEIPPDAGPDHPALDAVEAALTGEADPRSVEIALTVPTPQRDVLEAVRKVPPGERASLAQVAHMAGLDPDEAADLDTIRTALGENPTPVFVPDHRVEGEWATPPDVAARLRDAEGH